MTRMLALLTKSGAAIPETAICADKHWSKSYAEIRRHASVIKDWDGIDFVDCSDNTELRCVVCAATTHGRDEP
jgi:hypothetical protein